MPPVESEVKLPVPGDFTLPSFDGLVPGAHTLDMGTKDLDARYYDTPARDLLASGATLRYREEDGDGTWTLKLVAEPSAGGVLHRSEHDVAGTIDAMPDEIRAALRDAVGTDGVEPIARLHSRRAVVAIRDASDRVLVEVDDDTVTVTTPDGTVGGTFREVEAEIGPAGDAAVLERAVAHLHAAGAGLADPTPKLVRALRTIGGVVRAAGGVVWRPAADGCEVLVVHRPRYDDWSLPKGKADGDESDEDSARREVREETGFAVDLGVELPGTFYLDRKRRPKAVRYWAMRPVGGTFTPNDEVDELRWVAPAAAAQVLSYRHDADVVDAFVEAQVDRHG